MGHDGRRHHGRPRQQRHQGRQQQQQRRRRRRERGARRGQARYERDARAARRAPPEQQGAQGGGGGGWTSPVKIRLPPPVLPVLRARVSSSTKLYDQNSCSTSPVHGRPFRSRTLKPYLKSASRVVYTL